MYPLTEKKLYVTCCWACKAWNLHSSGSWFAFIHFSKTLISCCCRLCSDSWYSFSRSLWWCKKVWRSRLSLFAFLLCAQTLGDGLFLHAFSTHALVICHLLTYTVLGRSYLPLQNILFNITFGWSEGIISCMEIWYTFVDKVNTSVTKHYFCSAEV